MTDIDAHTVMYVDIKCSSITDNQVTQTVEACNSLPASVTSAPSMRQVKTFSFDNSFHDYIHASYFAYASLIYT